MKRKVREREQESQQEAGKRERIGKRDWSLRGWTKKGRGIEGGLELQGEVDRQGDRHRETQRLRETDAKTKTQTDGATERKIEGEEEKKRDQDRNVGKMINIRGRSRKGEGERDTQADWQRYHLRPKGKRN